MGKYDEAARKAMERTEAELAGMLEKIETVPSDRLLAMMPAEDRGEIEALLAELQGATDRNTKLLGVKACLAKVSAAAGAALKTLLAVLILLAAAWPAGAQPIESPGITLPFKAIDLVALAQVPERRVVLGVAAPIWDAKKILEWNAGALNKSEGVRAFTGATINVRETLKWMGSDVFHYRLTQDLNVGYAVIITIPDLAFTHGPQATWRFGSSSEE